MLLLKPLLSTLCSWLSLPAWSALWVDSSDTMKSGALLVGCGGGCQQQECGQPFSPVSAWMREVDLALEDEGQQRNDILRHSDATKAMRSPQRRTRCRATKFFLLRRSDATKAMRAPQRRTHCGATTFFGIPMPQRQCAAHSGARAAEQRNSSVFGCDEGNTQPTAARALQRDDILGHSDATKAMRSPHSTRIAEQRNWLIHGCPVMVVSLYWLNGLSTLNVIG